jgi:LruC domain-containing protein
MKILQAILIVACTLGINITVSATNIDNGQYIWTFLSGQPWPAGYQQSTGKPDNLVWSYNEYSSDFFDRINNALPEAQINESFLTNDAGSTISLSQTAEVFVTFIHEGAGYRNSFGYFTFDASNPPQSPSEIDEVIIFPNLSFPHLTKGHRLSLGTFPAGTSIGFFIAANGYWFYTGVKPTAVPYYYSLQNLNPESDPALRQHLVLLYDQEVSEVILGFEDLPRTWGDNDFNDAVFSVKSTPEAAINTDNLVNVPDVNDSDADGVNDDSDEFPNDYQRAYSSYYPNANDSVTLAFEDNWPVEGDYDLNDLVVREQLRTIYNANGDITGLQISGSIVARGAASNNGFAMRMMNVDPSKIGEATMTIDSQTFSKVPEQFQTDAVIIFWQDAHVFTQTNEAGNCSHFNTVINCSTFSAVPFLLDIKLSSPIASLNHSGLDFFIFKTNDRSLEIHFADYPPTDLFDVTRFGRLSDTSDPSNNRYFRNQDNLPWALQINSDWRHPQEYIDIIWAYPAYENWVESSGTQSQDWHIYNGRVHHIY